MKRKSVNLILVLTVIMLLILPAIANSIRQSITVIFNGTNISVNGKLVNAKNINYDDTLYVPLRAVAKMLNKDLKFDEKTKTVYINDKSDSTVFEQESKHGEVNGVFIGMSKDKLIKDFGLPNRVDQSIHGFDWFVYNTNLEKYVQVGLKDNKVVALYSSIGNWSLDHGIKLGVKKSVIDRNLGDSLDTLTENNTVYKVVKSAEVGLYRISKDHYAYLFFDIHNNNILNGIMIWNDDLSFKDIYLGKIGDIDFDEWQSSMSLQMFDFSNIERIKNNMQLLKWDESISEVAFLHSYDMGENNYFDHVNQDGLSPFDRINLHNIKYISASENIAMGQRNAIFAMQGLYNSKSHRDNILGDYAYLGIGVYFNTSREVAFYTQNFFTPLK